MRFENRRSTSAVPREAHSVSSIVSSEMAMDENDGEEASESHIFSESSALWEAGAIIKTSRDIQHMIDLEDAYKSPLTPASCNQVRG